MLYDSGNHGTPPPIPQQPMYQPPQRPQPQRQYFRNPPRPIGSNNPPGPVQMPMYSQQSQQPLNAAPQYGQMAMPWWKRRRAPGVAGMNSMYQYDAAGNAPGEWDYRPPTTYGQQSPMYLR